MLIEQILQLGSAPETSNTDLVSLPGLSGLPPPEIMGIHLWLPATLVVDCKKPMLWNETDVSRKPGPAT